MNTTLRNSAVLLFYLIMVWPPYTAVAITIDTVPVGNAGNANDPLTGNVFGFYGGVSYAYRIGRTEVTVGQYTAFLNAVGADDTYGLYNPLMATDLNSAGIAQSGVSGSYTYSVIGSPNKPVTYVNWGDAARFSNWMHNGQPLGPQGANTTEDGSYTLNGAIDRASLNAVTRNSGATWVIPTESEWYKAAYYNPNSDTYNQYPTSSNTAPTSSPPGATPNTANFFDLTFDQGGNVIGTGYAVTGSSVYSLSQNYLTDVGAYTASASPYGTFDQGGNVIEWNEALQFGSRGVRGGAWVSIGAASLNSSWGSGSDTLTEGFGHGFRVALVPEPATLTTATLAFVVLIAMRRLRRVELTK